jgi:hypothetical protein
MVIAEGTARSLVKFKNGNRVTHVTERVRSMKASETVGGQRIKWQKNDRTFEGVVRAYDKDEKVIGVIDDAGLCQIILPTQIVELV